MAPKFALFTTSPAYLPSLLRFYGVDHQKIARIHFKFLTILLWSAEAEACTADVPYEETHHVFQTSDVSETPLPSADTDGGVALEGDISNMTYGDDSTGGDLDGYGEFISPFTFTTISNLKSIIHQKDSLARHPHAFAKVGDSNTVAVSFMTCFSHPSTTSSLNKHMQNAQKWYLTPFHSSNENSFSRRSLSASVGWTTRKVMSGDPPILLQELLAVEPLTAVIMLGTNDAGAHHVVRYQNALDEVITLCESSGVIPILTTLPPLMDKGGSREIDIIQMNEKIRYLSREHHIPMIDLHGALEDLPGHGLLSDKIHLSVSPQGACHFELNDLRYGMNVRNKLTLETLDRVRRVLYGSAQDSP